jgi:hypothetical protein
MGKHASDVQKAAFLVHLQYVYQAEATRRAGLPKQTATDLKTAPQSFRSSTKGKASYSRR